MATTKVDELLATQQSLTEWLKDIKHTEADILQHEDNEKRERLKVLNEIIGLPFDRPTQFQATDLTNKTTAFVDYLREHGQELCALRLIPKVDKLPKLRMRGKTVADAYEWYLEQDIDPRNYRADFIPHAPDNAWATIFIVNKHGIQGEIIWGGHHQLTQGFHDSSAPILFSYDFKTWSLEPLDKKALAHLKSLATYLKVNDKSQQKDLEQRLEATFSHDYLEGYFETTNSSLGTWFIDYSPALGKLHSEMKLQLKSSAASQAILRGRAATDGKVTGKVCIVDPAHLDSETLPDGAILVCTVTTPAYVPLMQKAAAIVTDQGGILSHAAIVARELHKPCVVGTQTATTTLKNGQLVTVDANTGLIFAAS